MAPSPSWTASAGSCDSRRLSFCFMSLRMKFSAFPAGSESTSYSIEEFSSSSTRRASSGDRASERK